MTIDTLERAKSVSALMDAEGFVPQADSPFLLSKQEWTDVQMYVAMATRLPTTSEAIQEHLGFDEEDFGKEDWAGLRESFGFIAGVFSEMAEHCYVWETETYPGVIEIAGDVSQYAVKFPRRVSALRKLIKDIADALRKRKEALKKEDKDTAQVQLDEAKAKLDSVQRWADRLVGEVRGNQQRAQEAADNIGLFAAETEGDNANLGVIAKGTKEALDLSKATNDKLRKKISDLMERRDRLDKEYRDLCVVMATTPTYLFVGLIGLIAIPIVLGIVGDKATKLKGRIDELTDELKDLADKLGKKERLSCLLVQGQHDIAPISGKAKAAQEVVEKAKGVWSTIADDLSAIPDTLQSIISERADPDADLMEMDLDTAVDEWKHAGNAADAFRVYAYVKIVEIEEEAA